MTYNIDYLNLIVLVCISILQLSSIILSIRVNIERMTIIFIWFSTLVYSGISTIYSNVAENYLVQYIFFSSILVFTMIVMLSVLHRVDKKRAAKKSQSSEDNEEDSSTDCVNHQRGLLTNEILLCATILHLSYYIALIVQSGRGIEAFFSINLSSIDIFNRYDMMRSGALLEILHLINIFTTPFVFILMQRKIREGSKIYAYIMIFLIVYLYIISVGYIGRNQLLLYMLLFLIIKISNKGETYRLSFKLTLIILLLVLLSMPIMLAYESIRLGRPFQFSGFWSSASELFFKETDYGKYYDYCTTIYNPQLLPRYIYWFLTLPIPSAIAGSLKSNILVVSTYFSESILGVEAGGHGYYVLLPSILGESFILFGQQFYWVHAIFLGIVTSIACFLIERNDDLKLYNVYIAIQLLTLGRAGSVGYIGTLINGSIGYITLVYVLRLMERQKEAKLGKTKMILGRR